MRLLVIMAKAGLRSRGKGANKTPLIAPNGFRSQRRTVDWLPPSPPPGGVSLGIERATAVRT